MHGRPKAGMLVRFIFFCKFAKVAIKVSTNFSLRNKFGSSAEVAVVFGNFEINESANVKH